VQTVNTAIIEFEQSDEFLRLAAGTRKRHRNFLVRLKDMAGSAKPIAQLRRTDLDAVLAERRDGGAGERTLNGYKSTLRLFCGWLAAVGYTKTNIASHLKDGKGVTPKSKRKPLTVQQLKKMIELAEAQHPRDAMTLLLFSYTACRQSEVINLRWRDVDMEGRALNIYRPKMTDYHTVAMSPPLFEALEKWRKWVEEHHGEVKGTWFVVPARAHRGFVEGLPYKMSAEWPLVPEKRQTRTLQTVKRLMVAVGVEDMVGKGTHTLRRTAANLIVEKAGGDVRAAQFLLGHSSLTMTEKYLDVDAAAAKYGAMMREWEI